ncbi:hypothetical protein JOF55_001449 [Haloactinomyces albus]|uniref:Uncharacterized protein n=1 Tax=Haloactinomyces albus TaxID=1352928 RepID=A0AAE3ZCQ5_9ACTN|nr:hypothetical protein [Haloactinomyces albus]
MCSNSANKHNGTATDNTTATRDGSIRVDVGHERAPAFPGMADPVDLRVSLIR